MTETKVLDLAAWLTRIWDEEERLAKACLGVNVLAGMRRGVEPPRWVRDGSSIYDDRADGSGPPVLRVRHSWARELDHIVLHDPASVLARIAADRKILELHAPEPHPLLSRSSTLSQQERERLQPVCAECSGIDDPWIDQVEWPCLTVRLLASPHKGREGWQEEWGHE